jgi:hypothetical protein
MSNLQDLVEKPKAKRVLKGVHFDFTGSEITYTDWSQGGACSLENDMVLAKAKDSKSLKTLTPEQQAILDKIGEEHTALDKSKVGATLTPSSEGTGEEINEKGTDEMSEEILKELAELKRDNAILKASKTVSGFGFDDELEVGLSEALADLESDSQAIVIKALKTVQETTKAKAEAEIAEVKKNLVPADTDLQKALDEEAGNGGEPEVEVEKTMLQKAMEYQDAEQGDK